MRALAESSGCWSYIEPEYLTDTWVHFDKRHGIAACSPYVGYPVVKKGDRGVYVFVLQDALNALGFIGGGFDGIFGTGTENALKSFQASNGLTVDGIAGCNTWSELASQAKGIGKTSTVVLP